MRNSNALLFGVSFQNAVNKITKKCMRICLTVLKIVLQLLKGKFNLGSTNLVLKMHVYSILLPLRSVFSTYTENWRFLTWCKICSISRRSAISLFKTGPRCSCRTAKSKHKLLLCEVHKSSSIVQVTTVVLSLQKRSVSLSSLFPANVKYEKNGLKEVFLWHVEIPTKWKVYKSFSRSKHRPPCWKCSVYVTLT